MIEQKIKKTIRDIPNFPKLGIVFKDITPLLKNPCLCTEIVDAFVEKIGHTHIDAVAGIESRGFLFGLMLAGRLNVPFLPIRKIGKLPYDTIQQEYDLEYGSATLELHADALEKGQKVLIHDDLLATGGTVVASSELIGRLGGEVAGYAFLIGLDNLRGKERLKKFTHEIHVLASFR